MANLAMSENLIEFHCPELIGGTLSTKDFPEPIPAAQGMAARIKKMPTEFEVEPGISLNTVKKCPPFIDAMSSGYLIPAVADVEFTMGANGLAYKASLPIVDNHDVRQLAGTEIQRMIVIKFLNPWIIVTPPGYSCLIVAPLNRFEIPFQPLSGVVETDTFYRQVNFPSICLMGPGQSFHLKRGTPLVQVIPFRRDAWTSRRDVEDAERRAQWDTLDDREGRYKANNWVKKKFE